MGNNKKKKRNNAAKKKKAATASATAAPTTVGAVSSSSFDDGNKNVTPSSHEVDLATLPSNADDENVTTTVETIENAESRDLTEVGTSESGQEQQQQMTKDGHVEELSSSSMEEHGANVVDDSIVSPPLDESAVPSEIVDAPSIVVTDAIVEDPVTENKYEVPIVDDDAAVDPAKNEFVEPAAEAEAPPMDGPNHDDDSNFKAGDTTKEEEKPIDEKKSEDTGPTESPFENADVETEVHQEVALNMQTVRDAKAEDTTEDDTTDKDLLDDEKPNEEPSCEEIEQETPEVEETKSDDFVAKFVAKLGLEESPSDEVKPPLEEETETKDDAFAQVGNSTQVDSTEDIITETAVPDSPQPLDWHDQSLISPSTREEITDNAIAEAPKESVAPVSSDVVKAITPIVASASTVPLVVKDERATGEEIKLEDVHDKEQTADDPKMLPQSSGPGIIEESAPIPPPTRSRPPSLTFAKAFSPDRSEQEIKKLTPKSPGTTFSQAFGSDKKTPTVAPVVTSASVESKGSELEMPPSIERQLSPVGSFDALASRSSSSALSAAKNKRVSGLMSKYISEVAKEPLPGDLIPIKKTSNASLEQSPRPSPVAIPEVELSTLPDMNAVREMFDKTAKSSDSNIVFEFGESFRQKQRYEHLSDKEKEREARASLRGFDEKEINNGRTATGEIDTSNLSKTYTFEMSSTESVELHDGTCRVNYKNVEYKTMVFVVHRTRGMLLLHCNVPLDKSKSKEKKSSKSGDKRKSQIPGGLVLEEEFLRAAKQSGSSLVQLQIAAREAAARHLFEKTGLDVRKNVDRFKPAVLRLNPPVDARGVQYLKNENNSRLYYFLQVDEEDFVNESTVEENGKLTRPSEDPGDSALALRLCDDYSGFIFVKDPADASQILRKDGDKEATTALDMIMNEASEEIGEVSTVTQASVAASKGGESVPADEREGTLQHGRIRTVGDGEHGRIRTVADGEHDSTKKGKGEDAKDEKKEGKPSSRLAPGSLHDEADLKVKSSTDTAEVVAFSCCCGWW